MKFHFSFFLLLSATFNVSAQSELIGNWTGTLYQKPWNGSKEMMKYKFSMKLEMVNGKIQGKSTIITGPNFGVIDLKGEFNNNIFSFEEYKIEEQRVVGMAWCLKAGALKLTKEGTSLKMSGDWTGYSIDAAGGRRPCNPGNVVLTKEVGYISLKGFTIKENTSAAIPSHIIIVNKSTKKQVADLTCSTGEFDINLPGSSEYQLTVTSKGYLTKFENVKLNASQVLNIPLTPIVIGQKVPMKDVLFEKGTSTLTKDSSPELDRLLKFLKDNPTVQIEVHGHTSNEGDAAKNVTLSEDRVKVIKDYLVSKGIDTKRIGAKGFGASQPVVPNDTEENKKLNRRVEFLIVKK